MTVRQAVLGALITVLALVAAPRVAHAQAAFGACPAALPGGLQCTTVTVPVDRSGAVGGTLDVFVARAQATGRKRGTLVLLAGGPGDGASWYYTARGHFADFDAARRTHDLLIVDGRGSGRSAPLTCADAAACAAVLGNARGRYATLDTVADLEAVRAALGIERWSLYGVSYGTHAAQSYARAYPDRVESLVLDSVIAREAIDDPFALSSARALRPALRATCARNDCRGITRDPYGDLRSVAAAVQRRPLAGALVDGRGRRQPATLDIVGVGAAVVTSDVNFDLRTDLPAALAAARAGDAAPLLRLAEVGSLNVPAQPSEFSPGLSAAAACEEQAVPWERTTPADQRFAEATRRLGLLPADAFAPFPRESGLLASLALDCQSWPHAGERPVSAGALPNVPALLLNGDADLRTPTSDARAVLRSLPRGLLLEFPNAGHSVLRDDATGGAERSLGGFLDDGRVSPCVARQPLQPSPLPPRTRRAAPSSPRAIARLTVADALRQAAMRRDQLRGLVDVVRFGGLRGGYVRAAGSGFHLFQAQYVPGVRVSGRVNARGTGSVRVTAAGRRPQRVRLRGARF